MYQHFLKLSLNLLRGFFRVLWNFPRSSCEFSPEYWWFFPLDILPFFRSFSRSSLNIFLKFLGFFLEVPWIFCQNTLKIFQKFLGNWNWNLKFSLKFLEVHWIFLRRSLEPFLKFRETFAEISFIYPEIFRHFSKILNFRKFFRTALKLFPNIFRTFSEVLWNSRRSLDVSPLFLRAFVKFSVCLKTYIYQRSLELFLKLLRDFFFWISGIFRKVHWKFYRSSSFLEDLWSFSRRSLKLFPKFIGTIRKFSVIFSKAPWNFFWISLDLELSRNFPALFPKFLRTFSEFPWNFSRISFELFQKFLGALLEVPWMFPPIFLRAFAKFS